MEISSTALYFSRLDTNLKWSVMGASTLDISCKISGIVYVFIAAI